MTRFRRVLGWLGTALIAYLGVVLVLWLLENSLVYYPLKASQGWTAPPSPDIQDVSLHCADGTRVHGWWLPQPGANSALLYFHGNAGNISSRGGSIVKLRARLGVSVLIVDYPGYGQSDGRPSEAGCYQTADAAYAWLTETQGVAPQNILLYGGSLGGGVAVDLASRKDHRALVLISTFTSLPDAASGLYPWIPVRTIMRNWFASLDKIQSCGRPVFMVHGTDDELIPFALGKKLFEAAHEPKHFHVIRGGRHNDPFPADTLDVLKTFLEEHAPVQ